jgi:hypothetical protein
MKKNYIQVAGSPKTAVTLLNAAGELTGTAGIEPANWSAPLMVWNIAGDIASMLSTTGQKNLLTVALGDDVRYVTSTCNSNAGWKMLAPALPKGVKLGGITGDPVAGYIIASADGKVYQVAPGANAEWKAMSSPLPAGFAISMIAGDRRSGLLLVSGDDPALLAVSSADCCSWNLVSPSPMMKISLICGDAVNGYVVYGEQQIKGLTFNKDGSATWKDLPDLPFGITAMSGNLADGLVALIADGQVVVYCKELTKGVWTVARGPDHTESAVRRVGTAPSTAGTAAVPGAGTAAKPAAAKPEPALEAATV